MHFEDIEKIVVPLVLLILWALAQWFGRRRLEERSEAPESADQTRTLQAEILEKIKQRRRQPEAQAEVGTTTLSEASPLPPLEDTRIASVVPIEKKAVPDKAGAYSIPPGVVSSLEMPSDPAMARKAILYLEILGPPISQRPSYGALLPLWEQQAIPLKGNRPP